MPFAGYKDFADCVAKNQDKEDPQAHCAMLQKKAEGGMPDEEKMPAERSVRWVDRDQGIIAGIIVPYTGPIKGDKDLYGTRFSKDTDLSLDWFPDGGRPGLYSHGFDEELETEVIGRETRNWDDKKGRWLEAQIDKAHRYAGEIMELVDQGMLALSSGAVDHLVKINRSTRDVERWPWVEWSLVPNPGNPEALVYHVRSADAVLHAPEVAVRIVEDLDALVPQESAEDWAAVLADAQSATVSTASIETIELEVPDATDSVISLVRSLQPSALHTLALEMGAVCPEPPASEDVQPEPTVTITSSAEAMRTMSDEDLAALRDSLTQRAVERARQLTT